MRGGGGWGLSYRVTMLHLVLGGDSKSFGTFDNCAIISRFLFKQFGLLDMNHIYGEMVAARALHVPAMCGERVNSVHASCMCVNR